MSNGRGVIIQKPLFHRRADRQTETDRQPWWNQFTSNLLWRGHTNSFSMWRNRWKMTPLEVKILWGSHFFTAFGSKCYVKIWTVSAFNVEKWPGESFLTLKNDPGSHFITGSLFNVTRARWRTLQNVYGVGSPTVGTTSSVHLHILCRQIYDWNIVACDVKHQ